MIKYKKNIFFMIFPLILLILMFINIYLSPHIVEIKIANFFNNRLYLDSNISINLPKNWYHSISINNTHSKYGIIEENFILKNNKDGKSFFYIFFNKNNSGILKFRDSLSYNLLQQYSKKEYSSQYCKFIAYHSGNKIYGINIPSKKIIVFFNRYDKTSRYFIEELCRETK